MGDAVDDVRDIGGPRGYERGDYRQTREYFAVICSKCVGGLLPILAKMVHLDPAVMASPLITTLVDTVSLLVFFSFSKMILGI